MLSDRMKSLDNAPVMDELFVVEKGKKMSKNTCIGCEKPSKEGLCPLCKEKLKTLGDALAANNQKLELGEVKVKNGN